MNDDVLWLPEWLRSTLKDAERRLRRLGRESSAWNYLRVYLGGAELPIFGWDPRMTELFVGRDFRVAPRPSGAGVRRSAAWDKLQRHKRQIQAKTGFDDALAFTLAAQRNPKLYLQLKEEWGGLDPFIHATRARSEAERAAVAAAGIELLSRIDLDSEEGRKAAELAQAAFAVGYSLRDYELRQRFPELSRRKLVDLHIRRSRKAGKRKAGRLSYHNELLGRVVRHLQEGNGRFPGLDEVLELLGDPEIVSILTNADENRAVLAIRSVYVDQEEQTVDFVYSDGREKLVTYRTIRNFLSSVKKRR